MATLKITENFAKSFLQPIENLTERVSIKIKDGKMMADAIAPETSIIMAIEMDVDTDADNYKLYLPSVKKLRNLIEFGTDLDKCDILTVENNTIKYKSDKWNFTLHLLDDNLFHQAGRVSKSAIASFKEDISFKLSYESIRELVKLKSANSECEKVYFKFLEDGVYADVTDRTISNMDVSGVKLSDEFKGDVNRIGCPVIFDMIRLMSQYRNTPFKVKYSSKGVFLIKTIYNGVRVSYVVSENKN